MAEEQQPQENQADELNKTIKAARDWAYSTPDRSPANSILALVLLTQQRNKIEAERNELIKKQNEVLAQASQYLETLSKKYFK